MRMEKVKCTLASDTFTVVEVGRPAVLRAQGRHEYRVEGYIKNFLDLDPGAVRTRMHTS